MKALKTQTITEIVEKVIKETGDAYHDIRFICGDGSVSFYSGLLVPLSPLLTSVMDAVPCCVKNDPIVIHLDGFSKETVQAFVRCISTGETQNLTKTQLEEVVQLKEILRMNLELDRQVKVKEEKIDHHLPPPLTPQEVEEEQDRLMKKVMTKVEMFNGGAVMVPCTECGKAFSHYDELCLHYREHYEESLRKRKVVNNKPEQIVQGDNPIIPVPKKPRGRPRKSTEEKKVSKRTPKKLKEKNKEELVSSSAPRRERSSSSEKEFKCANPTFKIKAGEKKVRKCKSVGKKHTKLSKLGDKVLGLGEFASKNVEKMSPKLKQMLLQEENRNEAKAKLSSDLSQLSPPFPYEGATPAVNVVPEIKLSFDLGTVGSGLKEINLKELSAKKRGRKRKVESVLTNSHRGEDSEMRQERLRQLLMDRMEKSNGGPNAKMAQDTKTVSLQNGDPDDGFKRVFGQSKNNKDDSTRKAEIISRFQLLTGTPNGGSSIAKMTDSKRSPQSVAEYVKNFEDESTAKTILDPRPCSGIIRENVQRQLASMSTHTPFPEFLKNVCREANKTEGLVSGSNVEIEQIKDNHKVLEDVVRDSIVGSVEMGNLETVDKSAKTFTKDALNESSDCDNLIIDTSDE